MQTFPCCNHRFLHEVLRQMRVRTKRKRLRNQPRLLSLHNARKRRHVSLACQGKECGRVFSGRMWHEMFLLDEVAPKKGSDYLIGSEFDTQLPPSWVALDLKYPAFNDGFNA